MEPSANKVLDLSGPNVQQLYRKKRITITAVQFDGSSESIVGITMLVQKSGLVLKKQPPVKDGETPEIVSFNSKKNTITIPTLEGDMTAELGDYIIAGVEGETYPCKPHIFEQTYDRADDEEEDGEREEEGPVDPVALAMNLAEVVGTQFPGMAAAITERVRQVTENNFTPGYDAENHKPGVLKGAAMYLLTDDEKFWPKEWQDEYKYKLFNLPAEKKLAMATALLAAEADALQLR
jgi:hypothetical protein